MRQRTLRPSQIADLLRWLTFAPFHGEMLRCWPIKTQAQCEAWADSEIHRLIVMDLEITPVGRPRVLPWRAQQYITIMTEKYWRRKRQDNAAIIARYQDHRRA